MKAAGACSIQDIIDSRETRSYAFPSRSAEAFDVEGIMDSRGKRALPCDGAAKAWRAEGTRLE